MVDPFVLLSYHRHDEFWAQRIVARLEGSMELAPWPLSDDAEPSWLSRRKDALGAARAVVLLVSAASQACRYRREIELPLLEARRRAGGGEALGILVERTTDNRSTDDPAELDGVEVLDARGVLSELTEADADRLLDRLERRLLGALGRPVDYRREFAELCPESYDWLVRFFGRRRIDPETSRDLAQDTLARACQGLDRFQGRSSLRSWIKTIAINALHNHLRSRGTIKRGSPERSLDEMMDGPRGWKPGDVPRQPGEGPEGAASTTEARAALAAEVERLPPRQRECVELWLEGFEYKEIAERLGISIDNVKTSIHKGRSRVVGNLRPRFRRPAASPEGTGEER